MGGNLQTERKRGNIIEKDLWEPQPGPQSALVTCDIFEVFFGGARGGGKTDSMLGDFAVHADDYGSAAHGVFFRRTYKQLEEVQRRANELYPRIGAEWKGDKQSWIFPSGATLKMRHLWDAADAENYHGHSYTWICIEEATNWPTPDAINRVKATLRSAKGVPVKLRLTGNPGGPGHNWVKARYIDPAPKGYQRITDPQSGEHRLFIPSRLEDNKALTENDPHYEKRLLQSGSAVLVKAWRYGIWDIVAGGFFDDIWNSDKHIISLPKIPPTWTFKRSFDWGSSSPSSLGLWAESDGTLTADDRYFPRGSLIRIGEWYTVQKDEQGFVKANQGQRLSNEELGAGIIKYSEGREWSDCVADPSIFVASGGASIYDQMRDGARKSGGFFTFSGADNSRVAGWQKMRQMLKASIEDTPESPGLWVCENCTDWIRTVPVLQRSEKNPDDIDTDSEDHAADETRYCVMSGGIKHESSEFLL